MQLATYTKVAAPVRKPFIFLTALAAWMGIAIQLYITVSSHAVNRTLPGVILQFFSYFTIISNLLVALCLSVLLLSPNSNAGKYFGKASALTAIAIYISVVGFVFAVALRSIWSPANGLEVISNELLHTITPLLYIAFWLLFVNKQALRWNNIPGWLWLPGAYIIYIAIRGAITGLYPYPFINVSSIGYPKAIISTVILLLVFLLFGVVFTWLGRFLAKKQQ